MRPAILIYNPKSGRQTAPRLVPKLIAELGAAGFEVEPRPTAQPGDASSLARQAALGGDVEVVFALGGDGTLREAAAGLLGTEVALGCLPAGTTNVLVRALGLPRSPLAAAKIFHRAKERRIDVGLATPADYDEGSGASQPFLMMASGGLDSAVMANQNSELKKVLGQGAVGLVGAQRWWSYDYPNVELRFGDRVEQVPFFSLCNIPFYGGPFQLAPSALIDDGILDLILARTTGRWQMAGLLRDLALKRHLHRRDVEHVQTDEVEVVGPLPYGLQVDGDVLDLELPIRLSVAKRSLKVLAIDPS